MSGRGIQQPHKFFLGSSLDLGQTLRSSSLCSRDASAKNSLDDPGYVFESTPGGSTLSSAAIASSAYFREDVIG
jgi:hypothetical protein